MTVSQMSTGSVAVPLPRLVGTGDKAAFGAGSIGEILATFDGVAGTYMSTPDVNINDADTAHLYQSKGLWQGDFFNADSVDLEASGLSYFGGNVMKATAAIAPTGDKDAGYIRHRGATDVAVRHPATPGQTANYTIWMHGDANIRVAAWVMFMDNAGDATGEQSGTFVPLTGAIQALTMSYVAPATTETCYFGLRFQTVDATDFDGEIFYIGHSMAWIGTDSHPTFVPSKRIVGDAEIEAKLTVADLNPGGNYFNVLSTLETGLAGIELYLDTTAGNWEIAAIDDNTDQYASGGPGTIEGSPVVIRATLEASNWDQTVYENGSIIGFYEHAVSNPLGISDSAISVGGVGSSDPFLGDIYWVVFRDGFNGPIVAAFLASELAAAVGQEYTGADGRVWTPNGGITTSGGEIVSVTATGTKEAANTGSISHPHTVVGTGDKGALGAGSISHGHTVIATGDKVGLGAGTISHGHTVVATGFARSENILIHFATMIGA